MALSVGDKLGHYEVLSLLGQGGMGEVYRANDSKLNRQVAIKVLPLALARDAERLARFEREARVLASLDHPNIGHIHGIVDSEDSRGLVLALVEGPTLAIRIQAGPIALEEALAISQQIIEALEYAHDRGVVHRDLKPANVKITPEGVVKVLDFGLAKVLEDEPTAASSLGNSPTLTIGHTRAGVILGTAAYMSPEQAIGRPVDRRSDVFSFGAMLYEMLTGKQAFDGATTPDVLEAVVKSDPDWSRVPAQTPLAVQKLLRRCLVKDRKLRLQAIGEARIVLANPLEEGSGSRPQIVPLSARSKWLPWATSATFALAAIGFAFLWLRPVPSPEITRFEIHAPPGTTLPLGTPAPSPDGRSIAYTATDAKGTRHIYLRRMDRTEAAMLPGTEDAQHPFWSPDSRSIAFFANNAIRRTEIDGGLPRVLVEGAYGPWHGDWNQYGDILLSNSQRISANGGSPAGDLSAVSHPAFLPDGKRFLFRGGDGLAIRMGVLDSKNGASASSPVVLDVDSAPLLATVPNGKAYLLFLREPDLFAVEFDLKAGQVRGDPVMIVPQVGRVANPPVKPALGVSRNNGVLAFQTSTQLGSGELVWLDRAGKPGQGKLPTLPTAQWLAFSPDGRLLGTRQNNDVWVIDLARGSSMRLTTGSKNFGGAWSSDGSRIAVTADEKVMTVKVDGSGQEKLLDHAGNLVGWSGERLVVSQGLKISLRPQTGQGQPISFTESASASTLSPDGKFLAYAARPAIRVEVFVQALPPAVGTTQISVSGGNFPHWRGDGKELFFVTQEGAMMALDITAGQKFTAGIPHELFRLPVAPTVWDVTPDGQRFLIWNPPAVAENSPITVVMNWWAELAK